jgi:hypothetical protein
MQTTDKFNADEQLRIGWPYANANWFQIRYDNYNGFKIDLMIQFQSVLDLKHDIFGLFLTFRSKLFHNETVDGIKDVKDILSLLLGVV